MELVFTYRLMNTLLVGPDGELTRGTIEHRVSFPSPAKALRAALRFSTDYIQALAVQKAGEIDSQDVLMQAAVAFWRRSEVSVSGYPGIEDGPVADIDGFLADELHHEHAGQAALTVIGQIRGQEAAEVSPLPPSDSSSGPPSPDTTK